jgi:hypothetical protein
LEEVHFRNEFARYPVVVERQSRGAIDFIHCFASELNAKQIAQSIEQMNSIRFRLQVHLIESLATFCVCCCIFFLVVAFESPSEEKKKTKENPAVKISITWILFLHQFGNNVFPKVNTRWLLQENQIEEIANAFRVNGLVRSSALLH